MLVAHKILPFQKDESRKRKLLQGLDDRDITLNMESQIAEDEKKKSKFAQFIPESICTKR